MFNTLGYSPWKSLFLTLKLLIGWETDDKTRLVVHNDWMAERRTTMRTIPVSYWFYRGLPDVYPIFLLYLTGEPE